MSRAFPSLAQHTALAALLSIIGIRGVVHALQNVNSCTFTCTENCQLTSTLRCCSDAELCDGIGPIVLNSGADLNLNGHSLECYCGTTTCIGGSNNNVECTTDTECPGGVCGNDTGCTACNAAVSISASSSLVRNTATTESVVFGPFTPAVACNGQLSSKVADLTFRDVAGDGLVNCAQVEGNAFIVGGSTAAAIKTSGVATSDFVRDNYVEDWVTGISVSGTRPIGIDHNLISLRRSDGNGVAGIDVSAATSASLSVDNNLIMGSAVVPINGNAVSNFTANYCDPRNASCASCIGNQFCDAPTPPFLLP